MKLKTSHIIWGCAILIALANGENVRHSLASGNQSRREQSDFSDRIRENRTEARQAARLSKVALDRYRSNCILVVDSATGKENYFQPGTTVLDTELAQPLRPGVYVCNKLGDTARVTQAGTIADIARVAIPDLPAFRKLLEQQK